MRVNPNCDVPGPIGVPPVKGQAQAAAQPDKADLARSAELGRALENVPVARADKVAKAKTLIQDPSYPNEATLRQVADVLADHLKPQSPSE
jgi:hypothetical protein